MFISMSLGILQVRDREIILTAAVDYHGKDMHSLLQDIQMNFTEDEVITDLQETKDALMKASDLPLSILIVGVGGGADYKEMEILDADKGERLESTTRRVASRDIVQFVPFRDVNSGEVSIVQSLLAELPSQFLTYMRTRYIHPAS